MFPKGARLSRHEEVAEVFRKGKPFFVYPLQMKVIKRCHGTTRVAFIAPIRVFPKATERNRVKRVLREAFRSAISDFPKGFDIVVFLPRRVDDLTVKTARVAVETFLQKLK